MNKFSKIEQETLLNFLDDLSDRMGNSSCNDYEIPNTPEGAEFYNSIREENSDLISSPDDYEKIIITYDFVVLDYLRNKLKKLFEENK